MKAFIISPNTTNDRYVAFRASADANAPDLDIEHFPAVDGSALTVDSPIAQRFNLKKTILKGMVGCTLSHIALLKQCAAVGNTENYLIFEDDALINADWNDRTEIPTEADCATWHVGNISDNIPLDSMDDNGFIKLDKIIMFPTCAIEWTPEGARKFLSAQGKTKLLSQVTEHDEIMADYSDSVQQLRRVVYYRHDIQQMLYSLSMRGYGGVKLNLYVKADPLVNCGIYPSTISNSDYFDGAPLPIVIPVPTVESTKARMLNNLKLSTDEFNENGWTDSVTGLTLGVKLYDQTMFTSQAAGRQMAGTQYDDMILIKDANDNLHDIAYSVYTTLMARYAETLETAWAHSQRFTRAVKDATSLEELNAIANA